MASATNGDKLAENVDKYRRELKEKNKTCFVVGYTGEVGKELVKELSASQVFSKVKLIGRRKVEFDDDRKNFEQTVVDFDNLDPHAGEFDCDVGYCALGTTKGKSGKDGFIKIDHDYVLSVAKLAKQGSCSHFNLISSSGANEHSWFLYPQTKGQVEREISELGFPRFTVYRPAFLLCDREEKRSGERFALTVFKPLIWLAPTRTGIHTDKLARAMINCTAFPQSQEPKILNKSSNGNEFEIFENPSIHKLEKGEI